ncbi:hypothetical protein PIB30_113575, partial [Stylosanthes scabra]|nr:hypothetical protein [Stylosanthes scabra]
QKFEEEKQQHNLLQQNIQEGMQQKGELQQKHEESKENQKLALKPLPSTLKYAFLDKEETLPVIISSTLSSEEEKRLLLVDACASCMILGFNFMCF